MDIVGIWCGHDSSYCVLRDGRVIIHDELERFIREKEPAGDAIQLLFDNYGVDNLGEDFKYAVTILPTSKMTDHRRSFFKLKEILDKNKGQIIAMGHHQAHASNAFFSSNFDESIVITIDGGGVEQNNFVSACTFWHGKDNKILPLHTFHINDVNLGGIWTRATRYVFNLQSGWPLGHGAGTVMAMAALGDSEKYHDDFWKMITVDNQIASHKPPGQPPGANTGNDPAHPYLDKYRKIANRSEQDKFDLAAGLQSATERALKTLMSGLLDNFLKQTGQTSVNICIAGGVSLNSVMIGKIKSWFSTVDEIYIPPVPPDPGLTIGASQYVWHHILDNPRIKWKDNFSSYLGKTYSLEEVEKFLDEHSDKVSIVKNKSDNDVLDLLLEQNIVAVFGGGSESGRRALGNRSILADPRSPDMKKIINDRVKHRQWFRPFAPSILREEVSNWFTEDISSPYMSFVLNFKDEAADKVPAVVHRDGSARLQTVSKNDNEWYHSFLKKWFKKSSVPILLNTSFNDREPICETPSHAINCFLGTDIDYLYFYDYDILVSKK